MPRKKKEAEPKAESKVEPKVEKVEPKKPTVAERWEAMGRIIDKLRPRANKGDQEARAVLKRFFNSNPWLWKKFGDLAEVAEQAVLDAHTEHEWLATEAIRHEAAEMRKRLAGPAPTPLEEMAVRRIVASWLQLHATQMRCAEPQRDLGWARFWQRQLELAERMYDSAVRSLAIIKQLLPGDAQLPPFEATAVGAEGLMSGGQTNGRAATNGTAVSTAGFLSSKATPNGHVNRVKALLDPVATGHDGASANQLQGMTKRRGRNGVAVD